VRVTLPQAASAAPLSKRVIPDIRAAFEAEYLRLYGRLGPPVPLEAVTWRVVSSSPAPTLTMVSAPRESKQANAHKGTRRAYFPKLGGMVDTPVYDRYALAPGAQVCGHAIVEERESTLIVGPGARITVDDQLNLMVSDVSL
jgi:N-methylhydantoinase A